MPVLVLAMTVFGFVIAASPVIENFEGDGIEGQANVLA